MTTPFFHFSILTLFPDYFRPLIELGVLSRAKKRNIFELSLHNIRTHTKDPRGTVDDTPYGGGAGMIMMYEPLKNALLDAWETHGKSRVILLSPRGVLQKQIHFQTLSEEATKEPLHLTFVCGRYEGIDERFIQKFVDESWCLGDYVLTGGELPAMVAIDALVRLLPGALGNQESFFHESFSEDLLEHPHYTRPESIDGIKVPQVLLSGHHQNIQSWRQKEALITTQKFRPDLIKKSPKAPDSSKA